MSVDALFDLPPVGGEAHVGQHGAQPDDALTSSGWDTRWVPVIEATILGEPIPQGSARAFNRPGGGRPIVTGANPRTMAWRHDIVRELLHVAAHRTATPMTDKRPWRADLAFTMPKPKAAPKRTQIWPVGRPDLDKLVRAACDAVTAAGVFWADDSRCTEIHAGMHYPLEHPHALDRPGLRLTLWTVQQ